MRWGGAFYAVIVACAGCSLLLQPGEGDVTGGGSDPDSGSSSDANADAATNDGGSESSATGDGGAPPAGLLSNSGFESAGTIGCGADWTAGPGTAESSTLAHSGMKGCKVCTPSSGGQWGNMYTSLPFQPGTWSAQAWFHVPESGPAMIGTRIEIAFVHNALYVDNKAGGDMLGASASWLKSQTTLTSTDSAITGVNIVVGGEGSTGACVIVDDVYVEHE